MKQKIIILLILVFLVAVISAEEPEKAAKQVLKQDDVTHFIKTYPLLEKDMEKFNMQYEAKTGDVTIPETLKVSSEFLQILKKHGWDENYWQKVVTIMMGYSTLVYGQEMTKADIEMEKSLKEIDADPNIPEATKKLLKDQLKTARGMMKTQGGALQKNIHPLDLELIKPYIKDIQKIVDKRKKEEKEC